MTDQQFHDITEILNLCMGLDLERSAIVLNDQLGRGRSTITAIIVLLIQRWLRRPHELGSSAKGSARPDVRRKVSAGPRTSSWQIINSTLRIIRNGLAVKQVRRLWSALY